MGEIYSQLGADGADPNTVIGPGSAVTNNAAVRWDGTSGTLVQDSTFIISDAGAGFTSTASTGNVIASLINTGTGSVRLNLQAASGRESILQLGQSTDFTLHNSTTDVFQIKYNSTTVFSINGASKVGTYTNGRFNVTRTTSNDTELLVDNSSTGSAFVEIETQPGNLFADPFVKWTISTAVYSMGLDNSDSDVFSFTKGSSPSAGTQIVRCDATVWQNQIGFAVPYRASGASNVTVAASDYIIGVTDVSMVWTISLPDSGIYAGQIFVVKDETGNATSNAPIVDVANGTYNIDGATSQSIATNYGSYTFYFSGSNYFII